MATISELSCGFETSNNLIENPRIEWKHGLNLIMNNEEMGFI